MTGIAGCCARATSGHAVIAEPPMILMNSRRLIRRPAARMSRRRHRGNLFIVASLYDKIIRTPRRRRS